MTATIAGFLTAANVDAPAAGVEWVSARIALRDTNSRWGAIAKGTVFDAFIFHEAKNFTYFVDVTNDGITWRTIATAAVAGHAAAGQGTSLSLRVPALAVRLRVRNDGAAPATNFMVAAQATVQ